MPDWEEYERLAEEKAKAQQKPLTLTGIKLAALTTLYEILSEGGTRERLEAAKAIIAYFARVDAENVSE